MLVIAALMTSFYSWRLMFMTFYGSTRADHHTYDHAHESPPVMLIPLGVLSIGAVLAGIVFAPYFIGHDEGEFWAAAILKGEHNHILHAMHDVPEWVMWAPFIAMLTGFVIAYVYYIAVPSLPAATAKAFRPLYLFLLNKWYFDELYNFIFVKPAFALGRLFWKGGDGAIIDGTIDGTAAGVGKITNRVVKLQTGYVYHYAFAMLIGVRTAAHLLHLRQRRAWTMSNILSVITFLPLAVRSSIAFLNREANGNARWIALWTTIITFVVSLSSGCNFDTTNRRLPVRRGLRLARHLEVQDGRRRHFDAVRDPDDVPDAAVHPRHLGSRSRIASRNT